MTSKVTAVVDGIISTHFSGLADLIYRSDGDVLVTLLLLALAAIYIGWNAYARWYNRRFVEYYDAEWMNYDAWEDTNDL